ncbi:MAG: amino acid ABC transporter ATP-binding protein [Verrucomicrobia bacterium]|nr:amino acid ABC transporter ATP-binding protein [Verrucomicrobiota bacterium]
MFKLKDVSKTIAGKPILNGVSFEAKRGEITALLGPSGAGKSTLLRVCSNLEKYDTGSFCLDDEPLDLGSVNKNQTVGMVFQQFHLFDHLSVEENVMLAPLLCKRKTKPQALDETTRLLHRYGLEGKAKARVSELSGGQKQRVAIVRTLVQNPQIVCLDEPTSALDPKLTSQVASFIREIAAENRIVLLTTHDMGLLAELQANLLLMKQGAIVERTTSEEYAAHREQFPMLYDFFE